jgi:hypothetical protein
MIAVRLFFSLPASQIVFSQSGLDCPALHQRRHSKINLAVVGAEGAKAAD